MLNAFNDFIYPKGNSSIVLPNWKYFVDKLYNYNASWIVRFNHVKHRDTQGTALLINILKLADVDYMLKHGDDFAAYTRYVSQSQKIYDSTFDPVKLQSTKVKRYFTSKNGYDTDGCDIVLPVRDVDHLKILPLGYKYTSGWNKIVPLTYTYTPSLEYTQNLQSGTLAYKVSPPSTAIFRLDSVALVMKYFVWYSEHPEFQTDVIKHGEAPYRFLQEEIYPVIITQATTSFLWQLLNTVLYTVSSNDSDIDISNENNIFSIAEKVIRDNIIITDEYTNYFTDATKGIKDILYIFSRLKNRTIDIKNVLSMNLYLKPFSDNGSTNGYSNFYDFKDEIANKYNSAYLSQYYYIEFLCELFLLMYLNGLYTLNHKVMTDTDAYFIKKKYILSRLVTAVRPTSLQHPYVQNMVNDSLKKFIG